MTVTHARGTYLSALQRAVGVRFYWDPKHKVWCLSGSTDEGRSWETPLSPAEDGADAMEQAICLLESMATAPTLSDCVEYDTEAPETVPCT